MRGNRIFLVLIAVMLAVYLAMALWSLPEIARLSGGLPAFELRPFGYDSAQAHALLTALGSPGRAYYLNVQQKLDTAYPALLAVTASMAFVRLYGAPWRQIFVAIAVLGAAFDYLENGAVAILLRAGPQDMSDGMVAAASRWTMLKFGSGTLVMGAVLVGLAGALSRKRGKNG